MNNKICRCIKLKTKEELKKLGYKFPSLDRILGDILPVYINGGQEMVFIPGDNMYFNYYEYLSEEEYNIEECKKLRPQFFI